MIENLLKQLENCNLMSAVLEIKLDRDYTKEKLNSIRKQISNNSDYKVKNWCFINNENLYVIEVVKK